MGMYWKSKVNKKCLNSRQPKVCWYIFSGQKLKACFQLALSRESPSLSRPDPAPAALIPSPARFPRDSWYSLIHEHPNCHLLLMMTFFACQRFYSLNQSLPLSSHYSWCSCSSFTKNLRIYSYVIFDVDIVIRRFLFYFHWFYSWFFINQQAPGKINKFVVAFQCIRCDKMFSS